MPLTINVGLSRKASRDYQSTGVSINVTAELDSALLAKPDELQRQIDDLYGQAASAIARQVNAQTQPAQPANGHDRTVSRFARNGRPNGNRHSNGRNGQSNPGLTASQHRAIDAIAERHHVDPVQVANDLFGVEVDQLNIRQASELIDHLKGLQTNGNGEHR